MTDPVGGIQPVDESPERGVDVGRLLRPVLVMTAVMWGAEIADIPLDGRLDRFGIVPRQISGLDGVVFAPFLHRGFGHLIANTIPFLVLGTMVLLSGFRTFARVTVIVALVSGMGVWLFAPGDTVTIGASGLVFGYLFYLISRGFVARRPLWMAGGLVALMVYGGMLWGLVPTPGISWLGHLFGAVGGITAAVALHRRPDQIGS